MHMRLRNLGILFVLWSSTPAMADEPVDFATQIKPILTKQCIGCHGPDEDHREGGLGLHTRELAMSETDSGELGIVPGEPDESEVLRRLTTEDEDERMPPAAHASALKPEEIELIRRWIAEGAGYADHWSYVPMTRPEIPEVKRKDWHRSPLDRFVLARLEAEGLEPAAEASREKLIRRLSLDLIGLPPTVEEVDAFLADDRPDAYERLVDRLLASPAYGEHWARKWLDLARYADSQGYASDNLRTIWRYRDWAIRVLNADMPYDQFTIEQLAGDLLPDATDDQVLATAFHRNTMTNSEGGTDDEEFRYLAVVDRVNTTMQVWMGVTMGCAQCHTHKYDPIKHEEYFRFFALFNQTEDSDKNDDRPHLATLSSAERERKQMLSEQLAQAEKVLAETNAAETKRLTMVSRRGPVSARYVRVVLPGAGVFLSLAEVEVFAGGANVAQAGKASQINTGFGGPAHLAIDGNTNGLYAKAKSTTHTAASTNPWWEVDLGTEQVIDRIRVWNRTDPQVWKRLRGAKVIALDEARKPVWLGLLNPAPQVDREFPLPGPGEDFSKESVVLLAEEAVKSIDRVKALAAQVETLRVELAAIREVPTPVMRELAADKQRKTHLHIRGAYLDKGHEVKPGVPAAWGALADGMPADRLAMARWLVSPSNPLTARVAVNRQWEQLFGAGLVETSEDFGSQGMRPSHPKLLDWLAIEFIERGWSMKEFCRLVVTSATYRQSSQVTPEKLAQDPRNRLLSRGARFRLSAEQIRDTALAASGLLSHKMYGPPVRPPQPKSGLAAAFGKSLDWTTSTGEDRHRRGLYTQWRRTNPYPSMMAMDATDRTVCTVRRIRTNTPVAVFVTLNDPVYVEAAQSLARKVAEFEGEDLAARIVYAFRRVLTRRPTEQETERLTGLYQNLLAHYQREPTAAEQLATVPLGPLSAGMDVAQLATWTAIANTLLNLDEALTKD